jgi:hypothetical protein
LQQGGRLQLALEPAGQLLPWREAQLQLQPLRLVLARSPLLQELLGWLRLGGALGNPFASWLQPDMGSSSTGAGAAGGSLLRMWTSDMAWSVDKDSDAVSGLPRCCQPRCCVPLGLPAPLGLPLRQSTLCPCVPPCWRRPRAAATQPLRGPALLAQVRTERVDMLLGVGAQDVHLVLWGSHSQEELDMCIGIPAGTLQKLLGLRGLPEDYVLPLRVSGTVDRPSVDWREATKKLTILSALQVQQQQRQQQQLQQQQQAGPAWGQEAGGSWWQRAMGYIGASTLSFLQEAELRFEAEVMQVPPLVRPLPWEEGEQGTAAAEGSGSGAGSPLASESEAAAMAGASTARGP